ncbi:nitroreductase [Mycobacterium sp. 852002-10029_SCH5224772]|nr:nitroreductase [Mycobacterium sp. 852002-10029_SCH5224772]
MRVGELMGQPDMQLYDVMRTTFAAREFTDDPLPDEVLGRIFDNARFAPSGGNRQGAHVTVVRDEAVRRRLAELGVPAARRYFAQLQAGENPWNSIHPSEVPQKDIDATEIPETFVAPITKAPVVLVVSVDLTVVAAIDQDLDRVGIAGGASVYPLIWNVLLAARREGYGGTITTMAIAAEDQVRRLLGIPESHAVAAVVPLGKPVRQLTKLRRRPVAEFITRDRFDGPGFGE